MIKLSRKMEYALMSLKHMSSKPPDGLTTAKEISLSKNIPFDVTSRVLQIMAKQKVLESIQGVQGGYKLLLNPKQISLYQILEMIEGPQGIVKCATSEEMTCEFQESCNVHSPLKLINEKILSLCKSIPIADVIGSAENTL